MIGYIYKTTNKRNGKIYIGKRCSDRFEKWYKGRGLLIREAIEKEGTDAFAVESIEMCNTRDDLDRAERKWIAFYRESGADMYNIADGGTGWNIDWRNYPSDRMKDVKKKNSEAHLGKKNPWYGVPKSEEMKLHLHNKLKGRLKPASEIEKERATKRKHLRPIVQIDKKSGEQIRVWENWLEAAKSVSDQRCAYGHISECCDKKRKSAYGYKWAYKDIEDTI